MKIGIIGAGRLGLTFALLCEKNGYDVIVSDVREDYRQYKTYYTNKVSRNKM